VRGVNIHGFVALCNFTTLVGERDAARRLDTFSALFIFVSPRADRMQMLAKGEHMSFLFIQYSADARSKVSHNTAKLIPTQFVNFLHNIVCRHLHQELICLFRLLMVVASEHTPELETVLCALAGFGVVSDGLAVDSRFLETVENNCQGFL